MGFGQSSWFMEHKKSGSKKFEKIRVVTEFIDAYLEGLMCVSWQLGLERNKFGIIFD